MRFKEFFILRESPDHANFGDATDDDIIYFHDHRTKPLTLILTENIVYRAETGLEYHNGLVDKLRFAFNKTGNDEDRLQYELSKEEIYSFGNFDTDLVQFIQKHQYGLTRSDILNCTNPTILQARMWSLKDGITGISFWDKPERITRNHINLLQSFVGSLGYDENKLLFEISVGYNSDTEEDNTNVMNAEEFLSYNRSTHPSSSNMDNRPTPIHLLPPEQKKKALLAAGVKPKEVVPIQNRKIRSGD